MTTPRGVAFPKLSRSLLGQQRRLPAPTQRNVLWQGEGEILAQTSWGAKLVSTLKFLPTASEAQDNTGLWEMSRISESASSAPESPWEPERQRKKRMHEGQGEHKQGQVPAPTPGQPLSPIWMNE